MRILYVYNKQRGGGGSNWLTERTIETVRSQGMEVEVFCRDSKHLPPGISGRVQAGVSAIYPRNNVKEFERLLDSFKPDLVHAYELFPLISPWILPICSKRKVPVVMSCDDYHMTCPVRTHVREGLTCTLCVGGNEQWAVRMNCRNNLAESLTMSVYNAMSRSLRLFRNHVSHYIAASNFARQWFISNGQIDPETISAIPPFVDAPLYPADAATGTYIAFAGRFVPEKGAAILLEAARISKLPFRLSLIDRIPLPPGLDNVTLDRQPLNTFYRGARILAFPSIWFETFGLVAAEAMGHGIPVVGSRIGAVEEVVEDGLQGILCEPGNSQELAAKLVALWNDPAQLRRLGVAAHKKARSLWSLGNYTGRLMDVYERASSHSRKIAFADTTR